MNEAPLRLAMRVEGDWWVAYVAKSDDMEGAIELGRISYGLARGHRPIMVGFKDLMIKAMTALLVEQDMTPLAWKERAAPESERSGRA
jgi:hypothetical protein